MHRASRCQGFLSFDKRIQYCLGAVHTGKGRAEKSATAVHTWTCRRVNTDELSCPFRDAHARCLRCKWLDHVRDTHADGRHCCCHACPGARESVTFMLDHGPNVPLAVLILSYGGINHAFGRLDIVRLWQAAFAGY